MTIQENVEIEQNFNDGTARGTDQGPVAEWTSWNKGVGQVRPDAVYSGLFGSYYKSQVDESWFPPYPPPPYAGGARAMLTYSAAMPEPDQLPTFIDRLGNPIYTRNFHVRLYLRLLQNTIRNGVEFLRFHQLNPPGADGGYSSGYVARVTFNKAGVIRVRLGGTNTAYYQWFPRGYSNVVDFFATPRDGPIQLGRWYGIEVQVNITAQGGVRVWIDESLIVDQLGGFDCTPCGGDISQIRLGLVTSSDSQVAIGDTDEYNIDEIVMGFNQLGFGVGRPRHQVTVNASTQSHCRLRRVA